MFKLLGLDFGFLRCMVREPRNSPNDLDARDLGRSVVPTPAHSRADSKAKVARDCVLAGLERLQGWRTPSFSRQRDKVLSLAFLGEEEEERRRNAALQQVEE